MRKFLAVAGLITGALLLSPAAAQADEPSPPFTSVLTLEFDPALTIPHDLDDLRYRPYPYPWPYPWPPIDEHRLTVAELTQLDVLVNRAR
ncbi:MAG: hypothetical protein ABW046_19370 [Actinoplanes sp.]